MTAEVRSLLERIEGRTAVVGVVGLGYVGVPLARRAAEAGYQVRGIDRYMDEAQLRALEAPGIETGADFGPVRSCDVVLICVPTPLAEGRRPDTSFVERAARDVAANLDRKGLTLVVLESTSYPGTTREIVLPALEEQGLVRGGQFLLAYAPERVDPGMNPVSYRSIPRVVGGLDEDSGRAAELFYSTLVDGVHRVGAPEAAEMSKLLENIFRAVNIALVNEMSLLCRRMGIDVWEVVEAAATKPFGFMSFKPGPGMGGHCIPVDPFYLAWRARQFDFEPAFIELAGRINREMPHQIANWVAEALEGGDTALAGARVLVLGAAYKEGISDTRESPALKIMEILEEKGCEVSYHDPYVPGVSVKGRELLSVELTPEALRSCDCILIVTAHPGVDYRAVAASGVPVVDTRNVVRGMASQG